ncbi:catechol O-methyltransferase domain-containing protein 1 [Lissotriton helveticus]
MPFEGVSKEAVVGTAMLGVAFTAGVLVGKKYHISLFRKSKSPKTFDKESDPGKAYALKHSLREHPVLKKMRQITARDPAALHAVSSEEAQFLTNIAKLIKAKAVLIAGDSMTYLTLSMALTLPDDVRVLSCYEAAVEAEIGEPFWNKADVHQKIDLRIKLTLQILDELLQTGEAGTYDMVFINFNNVSHPSDCYEKSLRLLRKGGVLALDGVLCQRRVLHLKKSDVVAEQIHELNEKLLRDDRVNISTLPLGDGLTLAFKL